MKVLIVEDEEIAALQLKNMLSDMPLQIEVMEICDTVKRSVEWLQENHVDLIFMDVHLGDGDSFEIFSQIDIDVPVIFTTAYSQYALEAFKNKGIDYLLKPFDREDLVRAFDKLQLLLPNTTNNTELDSTSYQSRFLVTKGNKLHTIPTNEIAYFMADGKYLFIFTESGNKFTIDQTIGGIEQKLDPKMFFKINRKFIININAIIEMSKFSNSRIKIKLSPLPPDDIDAIVSGDKIVAFKQWLNG